ncbi:MAG TPA: DUF58 domain-containing protein [Polyangiaceae bacterium]|nr:DUF58 domain-containing protein [Polyangiaceae bacterium]
MISPIPNLSEVLSKVEHVELKALRALDSMRAGHFRSVFLGHGMEFDQVREYVPGDDVRHMDWSATARTGRPFVKVHVEERDLCVLIALDVSPSSEFGTVGSTKREQMAELAAVLAFAALRGDDRVGLVLFGDEIELTIPPGRGRGHVLRIVQAILAHRSQSTSTRIAPALQHLRRVYGRRAAVFLISDFYTAEPTEELDHALRVAGLQHEVVAVRCLDPLESSLPDVGVMTAEDAETGQLVELDTSDPSIRARYEAAAHEERGALRRRLRRADVDLLEVQTDTDYTPDLASFMTRRTRRTR